MAKNTKPEINQDINKLNKKIKQFNIKPTVELNKIAETLKKINPNSLTPIDNLPSGVKATLDVLKSNAKRFHGPKMALSWFPPGLVYSPCNDKFGYMTSATVSTSGKLDINEVNIALLKQLGAIMHEDIQRARKQYWREYKRKWRNEQRKKEKEFTITLINEELKMLTYEAKRHKMSRTRFLKETTFAYINKSFIVPDSLEVRKIS